MTSKLREAARALALAAETCSLIVSDALGALVEKLEPRPGAGPAEGYDDGKPYTLSDLEAMRVAPNPLLPPYSYQERYVDIAPKVFDTNTFAFRAEPWSVPHLPDCMPMECAEGCGHFQPLAVEIAKADPDLMSKAPAWVKAAAGRPDVIMHSEGCGPDGCVPGCKVMREKADRLAHAGYGNAFADAEIRDDEQTREADPVKRAHATVSRIAAEIPAELLAGDEEQIRPGEPDYARHVEELRCKHSRRYCESVPGVCCSDCSHGGDR